MTAIPPATEEKALAVIEGEFRDLRPTVSAEDARQAMQLYQEIAQAVTDKSDYQTFRERDGREHIFRKRSGWKKLERFYGVSVSIRDERIFHDHKPAICLRVKMPEAYKDVVDCGCPIKGVRYVVRAVDTRSGRFSENVGIALMPERRIPSSASLHDLATRAFNRGANRAVADLIGVSDPSAEEQQIESGFSQEERKELSDVWKAAHPDDRVRAIADMRLNGYSGETDKDTYIDFLRRGTEDDYRDVMSILRGPTESSEFNPDDIPIVDAKPEAEPEKKTEAKK